MRSDFLLSQWGNEVVVHLKFVGMVPIPSPLEAVTMGGGKALSHSAAQPQRTMQNANPVTNPKPILWESAPFLTPPLGKSKSSPDKGCGNPWEAVEHAKCQLPLTQRFGLFRAFVNGHLVPNQSPVTCPHQPV